MAIEEKSLSPLESLALISEAIIKTKENFKENSFYFMLWGWLISVASFSFFMLHQFTTFKYYFLPFPVLVAIGIVASLIHFFNTRATSSSETYFGYFFSRLWLVLGIGFIVVVFVTLTQKLPPFLFASIIAAIGTLISGLGMKFKPLVVGGIIFFAAAVIGVYLPDIYKPLLLGAAVVTGYLIPGYLLKSAKA